MLDIASTTGHLGRTLLPRLGFEDRFADQPPIAEPSLSDYSRKQPAHFSRPDTGLQHGDLSSTHNHSLATAVQLCEREVHRHPESANALVNLGMILLKADRFSEALANLENALSLDPAHFQGRIAYSRALLQAGFPGAALSQAKKLSSVAPHSFEAILLLAEAAEQTGDPDGALEAWTLLCEAQPTSARAHFHLGKAHWRYGNLNQAIHHLRRSTRLSYRVPYAFHALGTVYRSQGFLDRAEREFRKAIQVAPTFLLGLISLGHLLTETQRSHEAIRTIRSYPLAFACKDFRVREILGLAYYNTQQFDRARRELLALLRDIPADSSHQDLRSRAYNNLGACYWSLKKHDLAKAAFTNSIALAPPSYSAPYSNLALLLVELSELESALTILSSVPDTVTPSPDLVLLRSGILIELHRYQEARDILEPLVYLSRPAVEVFLVYSALMVDVYSAPDRALLHLQRGLDLHPEDYALLNNTAYALLVAGKTDEAREKLATVNHQYQTDPTLQATWGLLYLYEGSIESSVTAYKKAQSTALRSGDSRLASKIAQKMHLELARYHLQNHDIRSAQRELSIGLSDRSDSLYYRDMIRLLNQLKSS